MGKFVLLRDLSVTLNLNLGVGLEKRIGLEETQSLCGFLNNVDIGKPWWRLNHGITRVFSLML